MDCFQKNNVTLQNLKSRIVKPAFGGGGRSVCQKVTGALEAAPAQQDAKVLLGLVHPACPLVWSSLDWKQNLPPEVETKAEVWRKVKMDTFSSSSSRRTDQNLGLYNFLEA